MPANADSPNRPRTAPQRANDYDRLLLIKELEWLRSLTHVAPAGIYRVNPRGQLTYVNERWCELTGYSAHAAIGESWDQAVHPEDREMMKEEWRRCVAERVKYRAEHRFMQPNGRIVWALTETVREVDGRGETTGYTGMTADITELNHIREELRRSHQALEVRMRGRTAELQRMARIVENIDDAVISCDLAGRVLTWNRGAEKIFGYRLGEMKTQSIFVIMPESKHEEVRSAQERIRRGEEILRMELPGLSKTGELIELAISGFPLRDDGGEICGTWAIMRDITARKSAERRLHRLSWSLMNVQDEERRRIARDLHDSTAQSVAALAMNLTALARYESPLPEERRCQLIQDSLALAEQVTSELRTTAYLLHPPLLDERGLGAALGWLIEGFSKRSGIKVNLYVAADFKRLAPDVEAALFSVAREALHNVHRHAVCRSAKLRLTIEGGHVLLVVRDWGRGMPMAPDEIAGVGIAGMRERLLQFGGTLELEAADPGTQVIGRIPHLE